MARLSPLRADASLGLHFTIKDISGPRRQQAELLTSYVISQLEIRHVCGILDFPTCIVQE